MAKGKSKSRVSSKFNRPSPDEIKEIAKDVTSSEEPKRGRPKAKHGYPAFTTQIDPDKRAALKYIASMEGVKLFELIDEGLEDLLEKYKNKYPGIYNK
jgi:hypothetical protein